jgi:hypothetical protein
MRRLDALFRRYAANLEQWIPEHRGSFACPLCLRVIKPHPDLRLVVAEEHVIPDALGGRISTLTCRPCNNDSGSDLESHLIQRVLVEARKRPALGTVDIDGAVHRVELYTPESSDQPIQLIGILKQSDPRQVQAAIQRMNEGAKEIKLHMSFGYVPLRSAVALIRSAYLLMFRTFGYRYVLDASARPIREQLPTPLAETPVLRGISWRIDNDNSLAEQTQLAIAVAPLQCFFAALRLCDEPRHVAAVMLPPPGVGMSFYDGLAGKQQHHIQQSWTLPLPRGFFPFMKVWDYVLARDTNEKEKTA